MLIPNAVCEPPTEEVGETTLTPQRHCLVRRPAGACYDECGNEANREPRPRSSAVRCTGQRQCHRRLTTTTRNERIELLEIELLDVDRYDGKRAKRNRTTVVLRLVRMPGIRGTIDAVKMRDSGRWW